MAQRAEPNRNRRSATGPARTAGKTVSHAGKENRAGRGTLAKQRLPLFPELDHDTPRVMLKRIIQTQPQVSPLAPQTPQHKETEESQSELPSKRISNTGEMQLPDLVPENTSVATFHMTKKRKKLSISEFERAADKWLPQKQACSALDSTGLARSLHLSVGSLNPPDTVEKRGLARRPRNRRAIDVEAFEGRVEQSILKRKAAQDCFGDSEAASGIQTALLTNGAENVLDNTELFVQPQFDEPEQSKLPPPESHLWDSKTSAQRSESPAAAQKEAGLLSLGSSVSTNKKRTRSSSADLILDVKGVGEMTTESPQPPARQQDEKDHSQQDNPMEQLPGAEEVVDGTAEHRAKLGYSEHLEKELSRNAESKIHEAQDARANTEMSPAGEEGVAEGSVEYQSSPRAEPELDGVGAGRQDRHSHAFPSEKSGLEPLKEGDEEAAELENQAIMIELDDLEDEATENEAEDPESEEVSMKTPAFVRAPAFKAPLLTPPPVKPPAPKLTAPSPAKPGVPRAALKAKPERKTCEPGVPSSLIKNIFRHYVKMPVAREAFRIVEKCSERYFKQLSSDLEAYTRHAGRKTVEMADLEVLMRRQGLVTDKMPLHVLIEHYLPLEYRKLLIPVAVSGNKVIPCK
ncbi:centromere protein T isoform X2 [Calypte anna]|uniref:centromere protein T isoform X2 n=1 Tax=Calypte anna TaxID=9244 RepID=UPI0011C4171D|nr:centromere protein T isoform X2 [Calypte anna]